MRDRTNLSRCNQSNKLWLTLIANRKKASRSDASGNATKRCFGHFFTTRIVWLKLEKLIAFLTLIYSQAEAWSVSHCPTHSRSFVFFCLCRDCLAWSSGCLYKKFFILCLATNEHKKWIRTSANKRLDTNLNVFLHPFCCPFCLVKKRRFVLVW